MIYCTDQGVLVTVETSGHTNIVRRPHSVKLCKKHTPTNHNSCQVC